MALFRPIFSLPASSMEADCAKLESVRTEEKSRPKRRRGVSMVVGLSPHFATLMPSLKLKLNNRLSVGRRSEEHTSELQSPDHLVCRLLLEKKKKQVKLHKRCS